jgi:hypothetical protein
MKRQVRFVIDSGPILYELHWKIDVNPAIGFFIDTERADAYRPVNCINF